MSQFLAPTEQDPVHLFLKPVKKVGEGRKMIDIDVKVQEQLKPTIKFDLISLSESGQLTLLQISEKYGVLLFAFGPELIVVTNSQLNQVLETGNLLIDQIKAQGSNKTHSNPITFLKIHGDYLFLQHQDDDFLVIANLSDVVRDPKKALQDADRCKMDLGSVCVRQVCISDKCFSKIALVLTRNTNNQHSMLLVNYDNAFVIKRKDGITSATFSSDGQSIIAGNDGREENILVFDLNLNQKNSIKFSLPQLHDDIEVDEYRVLWVCEPYQNNQIVFVSYFQSQDDLDDKIGKTMMIWMGGDISKPGLTMQALKDTSKIKACFWEYDHQNDDIIPSFDLEWYQNPRVPNEMLGFAMQNHCDQPYIFKMENNTLKECYEFTNSMIGVDRPIDPQTDEVMDAQETLGACLGFQILRTKMQGAPDNIEIVLIDDEGEEVLPFPQMMLFYSLDGRIKQYQVFLRQWRQDALTHPAQPLGAPKAQAEGLGNKPVRLAAQAPQVQAQVPQAKVQEENKREPPSAIQPKQPQPFVISNAFKQPEEVKVKPVALFGNISQPQEQTKTDQVQQKHAEQTQNQMFKQFGGPSMQLSQPAKIEQVQKPQEQKPQFMANVANSNPSAPNGQSLFSGNKFAAPAQQQPQKPQGLSPLGQQLKNEGLGSKPAFSGKIFSQNQPPQQATTSLYAKPVAQQHQFAASSGPFSTPLQQKPIAQPMQHQPQQQQQQLMNSQNVQSQIKPSPLQKQPVFVAPAKPKSKEQIEAELLQTFTEEGQIALTYSEAFQKQYNEHVVEQMNKVTATFPDRESLQKDIELQQAGYHELCKRAFEDQNQRNDIKESLQSTQRYQLTTTGQQQLCDRLKREVKYGILGDQSVSAANPASDLMKVNQTYRQFIKNADYNEEDKAILLEVFESGNKAIDDFDKIQAKLVSQETLQSLHQDQMSKILNDHELQMYNQRSSRGPFAPAPAPSRPGQFSMAESLRQNLLKNAGFVKRETDISKYSAQAYVSQSTEHFRKVISDVESNYERVQARLRTPSRSDSSKKAALSTSTKRPKYGDPDEDCEKASTIPQAEAEMKQAAEVEQKQEDQRKMVRNRKRQKQLQQQLLQQVTRPQICQLEIRPRQKQTGDQSFMQKSINMPSYQKQSLALSNSSKSKEEKQKEQKLIERFVNVDGKKRELAERDEFIATLDSTLITSPNLSPRPRHMLGQYAEQMSLTQAPTKLGVSNLSQGGESVKPQQSTNLFGEAPKRLDSQAAKGQNSFLSFGSKQSDNMKPQPSSKIAQQMSFGDEPKMLTSVQKKQVALDQIAEKESPQKEEKKDVTVNPFTASTSESKPLQKQQTMPKLNIDIKLPLAKKTGTSQEKEETEELLPQKTMNFTDFKLGSSSTTGSKPKGQGGLFDTKKPVEGGDAAKQAKDEPKKASIFGDKSASNLNDSKKKEDSKQAAPSTNSLFGGPAKTDAVKPSPTTSLFGAIKTPDAKTPQTQPSVASMSQLGAQKPGLFGQAPPMQPMNTSALGAAQQNKGPSVFGQVDISSQVAASKAPQSFGSAFGAPAGQTQAAKPMTFASAGGSGGAAGGVFKFANAAPQAPGQIQPMSFANQAPGQIQPLSFGNAPSQGGIFSQPSNQMPQQQMPQQQQQMAFGGFGGQAQPAPQNQMGGGFGQPGGFGAGAQSFQGFGGGGNAFGGASQPQTMSAAMLKPRK